MPPLVVLQWAPTFPAVQVSQSWSSTQSKSQSEFAVQLRPILPRVQVPPPQIPVPGQLKVELLQVPGAAAVQVPKASVQVRMSAPGSVAPVPFRVSMVPLHAATAVSETARSGVVTGSGTVSPSPPR